MPFSVEQNYFKMINAIKMSIVACFLLFGLATSEKYTVILFPFAHPPDERSIFAKLSVDTTNTANTTITHGNHSLWLPGRFNFSISNTFPSNYGIFTISITHASDVVMEIHELRRSNIFSVHSLKELGTEYILVSSSEISQRFTCRVSSSSRTDVVVNIKAPPRLQHALNLYGTCSGSLHCILKTGKFIEISSTSPLYQTVVASSDTLVIFCKDDSIFQVLPKTSCGLNFQMSCPMFNSTNVSNCTAKINTVQSKRQNIRINRNIHTITNFFVVPLERGQSLTIQSEYDVCVLFADNYHDNSDKARTRTEMLSSSPYQTALTMPETTLLTTFIKIVSTKENHVTRLNTKFRKNENNTASTTFSSAYSELTKTFSRRTSKTTPLMNPITTDLHTISTRQSNVSSIGTSKDELSSIHTTLKTISPEYVNLTSTDLIQTTNPTKTRRTFTTSVQKSKKICNCACRKIKHTINDTGSTKIKLHELIAELKVNKSELSSEVRRISCAKDDRRSSEHIGYVGAVVIILVMATIVSFDLINLFQKCDNLRKDSKKPKRRMPIACREQ